MDAVDISLVAPAKTKRFKLLNSLPLAADNGVDSGAVVGAGRATKTRRDGTTDPTLYLVEDTGTQAAITMHAVATGVAGGIISIPSLVAAFKATGKLDDLAAEVVKVAGLKLAPAEKPAATAPGK